MNSSQCPSILRAGETRESWEKTRRVEIRELLAANVYGRSPEAPKNVAHSLTSKDDAALGGQAVERGIVISFNTPGGPFSFPLTVYTPRLAKGAVPVFLFIDVLSAKLLKRIKPEEIRDYVPLKDILSRGYAVAVLKIENVDPDEDDDLSKGLIHRYLPAGAEPKPGDWAKIAEWAFAASRAIDFLATDGSIDSSRISVVGHSRGGKISLWCGALDTRVALTISCQSGSTGAALSRGKQGERVQNINEGFPHWFCGTYKTYNGKEETMPFDQHMALSLVAPRLLYVSSATEDTWSDPNAEFRSCVLASPVYRLYGERGIETETMPPPEHPLHAGHIAYHAKTGGHSLGLYDWTCYMDYADRAYGL